MSPLHGYLVFVSVHPVLLMCLRHLPRWRSRLSRWSLLTIGVAVLPALGRAQATAKQRLVVLEVPGQELDDRVRLRALEHADSGAGLQLRSASTRLPRSPRDGLVHVDLVAPEFRTTWNSQLPWSMNDGASRAPRGLSSVTRFGFVIEAGAFRAIIAPEVLNENNERFPLIPYGNIGSRSMFAHPFHGLPESIDLPLRFGIEPRRQTVGGQSSVTVDIGRTVVGLTTENQWWGPGMRNALLLGANAEGVPRLFVRSRGPIVTRFGTFDGQWFLGRLRESSYFDYDSTNNVRALSAIAGTWRPAHLSQVEFGFARLVLTPTVNGAISLGTAFNAFHSVGRPNTSPKHPGNFTAPDQMFSLFARLALPEDGFEAWVEWARTEEPTSLRDLLEQPAHSQGYTLGMQAVRPVLDSASRLRVRVEATYFEPSSSLRFQPNLLTSYTSRAVPQGFTQDGQMLGAAIGPGSSSQFAGVDLLRTRWDVGAFVGRIRHDNGLVFGPTIPEVKRSDVTMFFGLRGGVTYGALHIGAQFQSSVRLNYLYQAYLLDPTTGETAGVDYRNRTLSIVLSPAKGF